MATEHTTKARKRWACLYGSDYIEPGETYIKRSFPPWTTVPVDVDDDGATIYDTLGQWETERYHAGCRDRDEAGR
jgi:hypothetical protein